MAHVMASAVDLKALHPEAVFLRILGVDYVHLKTDDEGDLYLTRHGLPFLQHLLPENWYEAGHFAAHKQRLHGTSTVYRIPTKSIEGQRVRSIDIVVKWSRVGQEVDLNTFTLQRNLNAEFNTPFEEFALLEELRRGEYRKGGHRVLTQKPLAIYVPPEFLQPWQTGRSKERILAKTASHPGVAIDVLRAYILIYGWVKGVDAVEAFRGSYLSVAAQRQQMEQLTRAVDEHMNQSGFIVADHKPTHVIVRQREGVIRRRKCGRIPYAVVDYELMSRTPDHENAVRTLRRSEYLNRQRDRFLPRTLESFPEHLCPARVLDVDYVYGRTESTSGTLWVVGNDPELFAYFLPERWRGMQVRLSDTGQTYYTHTKDRVHLVWKVSKVGEFPPGDLKDQRALSLLLQGFNSPFEEFSLALAMQKKGLRTVYPRAIYMTASPGEVAGMVLDDRAVRRMAKIKSPGGKPVLPMDHDYVTLWGYWRGVEDSVAASDQLYTPIDAAAATANGLITEAECADIMERHCAALAAAGFEDSNLKPDHVLLSHIPGGNIKADERGEYELRHCNFEFVRLIRPK